MPLEAPPVTAPDNVPELVVRVRVLEPRVRAPTPEIEVMVWFALALVMSKVPESVTDVPDGSEPPAPSARVPEEIVVEPV